MSGLVPQFPRLSDPIDAKQIEALNVGLRQLRDLLTGQLNVSNTVNEIVDVPFQAPNAPSFKSPTKPLGVEALAFESVGDNPASVAMANPFQWSWTAGTVTVPSLAGLSGATKYTLRVRVTRG